MINWQPILNCWGFDTPEQLFKWLYIDQGLSRDKINQALGITSASYYIRYFGIKPRPRGFPKKIPDDAHLLIDKLGIKGAAYELGVSDWGLYKWQQRNNMRRMSVKDFSFRSRHRPLSGEDNDSR